MPETKRTLRLLGQDKEVTEVPVVSANEEWSTYVLEDGTTLKYKTVATSVLRVDGEYNPDGSPVYLVIASAITHATNVSDALRRSS